MEEEIMNGQHFFTRLIDRASKTLESETGEGDLGDVFLYDEDFMLSDLGAKEAVELTKLDTFLETLTDGGPSWIHAHIMRVERKTHIALSSGDKVDNPTPNINVSWEGF